ncbi:unnamed protein product [Mucor hiemalis]
MTTTNDKKPEKNSVGPDKSDDSYSLSSLLWPTKIYDRLVSTNTKLYYEQLLKSASDYDEWSEIASKLDELDGLDKWKKDNNSPDYDWELIKTRLDQIREI